jgi:erythromycin esterase
MDLSRIHALGDRDRTLAALLDIVGDSHVVAIGEGAHFVAEYWQFRRHLVELLHRHAGFQLVAMEFGVGEALQLTSWLSGDAGDDGDADLSSISPAAVEWGAGDTMVWLRHFNAAAAARGVPPLRFAGIDLPSAGGAFTPALTPLETYLHDCDPELASTLDDVRAITGVVEGGSGVSAARRWSELDQSTRDAAIAGLARIVLRMTALRQRYETRDAGRDHRTALLLGHSALATAYMLQATAEAVAGDGMPLDSSVRERFLADAVLALRETGDDKVVVLAHNNHVQKTPVVFAGTTYTLPMGSYLAGTLGDDYRVIAQTTTDDHVPDMVLDPAGSVGFRVIDAQLPEPAAGTFEHALLTAAAAQQPTLTDVRPCPKYAPPQGLRSQSAVVDTDVSAAFDAVVNHPRVTRQPDVHF